MNIHLRKFSNFILPAKLPFSYELCNYVCLLFTENDLILFSVLFSDAPILTKETI